MSKFNLKRGIRVIKRAVKECLFWLYQNKLKITLGLFSIFIVVVTGISIVTKTNLFMVTVRNLLAGLGIYTEEILNVEVISDGYNSNVPGAWHIDKSAEWVSYGKARVTFSINSVIKTGENSKDIILVLDISDSMSGLKIDKAKNDAKELISYLLTDTNNRVALITFSDDAKTVEGFSTDKDTLLTKVDQLKTTGATNYNAALQRVLEVMNGYKQENDRDAVVLFLTDGYPCVDTPNEVATYEVLKDKYAFLAINGIQYEMGTEITEEIKQVTDKQWVADTETLNNVLFEASVSPIIYDEFVVNDYVNKDYFTILTEDDIKVPKGEVTLTEEDGLQKVSWKLDGVYMTGGNIKMTIDLSLKSTYLSDEGLYPTNDHEVITSRLPDGTDSNITSSKTPVLKNIYEVKYNTNTPAGCSLDSIPSEKYAPFQNVEKKNTELVCDGYLFKGWEMTTSDAESIKKVNDDVFIMPPRDVTIMATWTKHGIEKTMDGTVHEKLTLYKVLEDEAKSGGLAKEYTGSHKDSVVDDSNSKIYHYYATTDDEGTEIQNKNNVVFANTCWQMIRTTDTGGVKLLYNGAVDADGKCGTGRASHVGYTSSYTTRLASNYYYGTSYTYDTSNKKFSLAGTVSAETWSDTTYQSLLGKYTCLSTTADGTCSTLYYVDSYYSSVAALTISVQSGLNYSVIGRGSFNSTTDVDTLEGLGYMYNKKYESDSMDTTTEYYMDKLTKSTYYWFATRYTYNANSQKYVLNSPYQVAESGLSGQTGKYTLGQSSSSAASAWVYQIMDATTDDNYFYSYLIMGNEVRYKNNYTYGDSYTANANGTYTIKNATTISSVQLITNYTALRGKYVCKNATNNTCSNLMHITNTGYMDTNDYQFYYYQTNNAFKISDGFTYSNGVYKLNDSSNSTVIWDHDEESVNKIKKAHYTCFNTTGECSTLSYFYGDGVWGSLYVNLENGEDIDDALVGMLNASDINTKDSFIKKIIDSWYTANLSSYTDYLEDTVFCNNRKIQSLGGWDATSTNLDALLFTDLTSTDLSCPTITDQFSVNNSKAKLKYPIGLMSVAEMNLLNNDNARTNFQNYYLMTPIKDSAIGYVVTSGKISSNYYGSSSITAPGIRPAISLVAGTEYIDGDGSMDNPYVVDVSGE